MSHAGRGAPVADGCRNAVNDLRLGRAAASVPLLLVQSSCRQDAQVDVLPRVGAADTHGCQSHAAGLERLQHTQISANKQLQYLLRLIATGLLTEAPARRTFP